MNSPRSFTSNKSHKTKPKEDNHSKLRVHVIIDETPFFHPRYLDWIVRESKHAIITGITIVELPNGGKLQQYLVKNWRNLGLTSFGVIALRSLIQRINAQAFRHFGFRTYGSVKEIAKKNQIPFVCVNSISMPEYFTFLKSTDPDLFLSSNSLYLPENILELPKRGCINRHSSLSPSYGGVLPIFYALSQNENVVGVTVHKMVSEIDEGEILVQKCLPVYRKDTVFNLYKLCFELSAVATEEAFFAIRTGAKLHKRNFIKTKKSYNSFPDDKDWMRFNESGHHFS